MNEDVMWERLKDIQREVENSRRDRRPLLASAWDAARLVAGRAGLVAGMMALLDAAWTLSRGVHPRWWAQP